MKQAFFTASDFEPFGPKTKKLLDILPEFGDSSHLNRG
jgi:hypothetical protein